MKDNRKYMIIDIGSNTVKYDIFNKNGKCIYSKSTYLGFINYIKNGVPSDEGIDRLCDILLLYRKDAKEKHCDGIFAYATASFRSCSDPEYPAKKVSEKTGIKVRLLSWQEEAEYSFRGMLSGQKKAEDGLLADMGGASTELTFFINRECVYSTSLLFGALKLKNMFASRNDGVSGTDAFASKSELDEIMCYTGEYLGKYLETDMKPDTLYLVGGSAKAIGKINRLEGKDGKCLTADDLMMIYRKFSETDEEKAELLKSLIPDRYLIVMPACAAFIGICRYFDIGRIIICDTGIRNGAFYENYLKEDKSDE